MKRFLPAVALAALLFPGALHAEPVTIGVHTGGATALLGIFSPGVPIAEITLPEAGAAVNLMFNGLTAREDYQMELLVFGSTGTWNTLRAEVLDPLDGDDGLDVKPYHDGVPDGFTTSNDHDGLSFAQRSGLQRSAAFAGGFASVTADEDSNARDVLLFSGVGTAPDALRVTFGLRDYDGNRNFLVRLTADDALGTPEPASMLLIGTGLAGLAAVRRRRRGLPPHSGN